VLSDLVIVLIHFYCTLCTCKQCTYLRSHHLGEGPYRCPAKERVIRREPCSHNTWLFLFLLAPLPYVPSLIGLRNHVSLTHSLVILSYR